MPHQVVVYTWGGGSSTMDKGLSTRGVEIHKALEGRMNVLAATLGAR